MTPQVGAEARSLVDGELFHVVDVGPLHMSGPLGTTHHMLVTLRRLHVVPGRPAVVHVGMGYRPVYVAQAPEVYTDHRGTPLDRFHEEWTVLEPRGW